MKNLTRNIFIVKTLIILSLSVSTGYFWSKDFAKKYQEGTELTKETYQSKFDEYKNDLLNYKKFDNQLSLTFSLLIYFGLIIGSYELISLILALIIRKVIKKL